jgi:hypothetical protein
MVKTHKRKPAQKKLHKNLYLYFVVISALVLIAVVSFNLFNFFVGQSLVVHASNNKNPDWYVTCSGADPSNPDQIPPTVTLTTPVDNTYVDRNEVVNFRIDASDNVLLNRNEIYVNNVLKGVVYSSNSPYYQSWQVPSGAKRGSSYTVYTKVCDQANNYALSPTIRLIVR